MISENPRSASPWIFFLLVYALSIPFWLLSPHVRFAGLPDNLPITDVGATFVPLLAAVILSYREQGRAGVKRLLARVLDFSRIQRKRWYLPIFFLMPLLYLLIHAAMRAFDLPLPAHWNITLFTPLLFLAFFVAAAGEEVGYMGYAIDPMQARWSALAASLIIGTLHAFWHYPSMIGLGQGPALMAWGTLATISLRVLMVWLYNNCGRSVFAVVLFHAMTNTGRSSFPGGRAGFEANDAVIGYSIIAIAAVVVILLWGPNSLAKFRLWNFRPKETRH